MILTLEGCVHDSRRRSNAHRRPSPCLSHASCVRAPSRIRGIPPWSMSSGSPRTSLSELADQRGRYAGRGVANAGDRWRVRPQTRHGSRSRCRPDVTPIRCSLDQQVKLAKGFPDESPRRVVLWSGTETGCQYLTLRVIDIYVRVSLVGPVSTPKLDSYGLCRRPVRDRRHRRAPARNLLPATQSGSCHRRESGASSAKTYQTRTSNPSRYSR